ncbi:MAG: cadherin-like domain-containing protein [Planctomycetaceae bacterium]|nr:cadherin-like domain-containing protein [Planctomycetaceae bacterium]
MLNGDAPVITDLEADPAAIQEGGSTTLWCAFADSSQVDVHTVSIDWGDGSSDEFDLTEGERGFARPHQYLNENPAAGSGGAYTILVAVTDRDGGIDTETEVLAVANVAPVVSAGEDAVIKEGETLIRDVTFTDPGVDQWTAQIDYGDGSALQTLEGVGKTFKLEHDFGAKLGTYNVQVQVTDDQGALGTDTFSVTVENAAPSLWVRGLRVVAEGTELVVADLGIFTDPGHYEVQADSPAFTYEIDWGDGTVTGGNADVDIAGEPGKLTWGTFDGAHTYQQDGRYVVTVGLNDDHGGFSPDRFMTVVVNNAAPRDLVVDDIAPVNEGEAASVHGTFEDASQDAHTVTVTWGDGTDDTVVELAAGVKEFTIPHTYADDGPNSAGGASPTEIYTVRVTVADADGGSTAADKTVEVSNVAPVLAPIANAAVQEGGDFTFGPITFTDAGAGDTHVALIDWGDGTPAEAAVVDPEARTVSGSHAYGDEKKDDTGNVIPYTVTVTVTDDDGGVGTGTFQVTVGNANPQVTPVEPQEILEGQTFSMVVAGFADPGTGDTHTALIDWGDGTPAEPGTVNQVARTVSGSHVYADEKAGGAPYTVTVTVTDDDGGAANGTFEIAVGNADPQVTPIGSQTISEGESLDKALARFADAGSLDTHTALIDWGDGTQPVVGVVDQGAGTVSGSHVYPDEEGSPYTVTVTVTDNDGGVGTGTFQVTVSNAAPVLEAIADTAVNEGDVFTLGPAAFTDAGTLDTHTALINWGDGTAAEAGSVNPAARTVSGSHIYADEKADGSPYTVTVTVTDNDGGVGTRTFQVTVNNVDPVAGEASTAVQTAKGFVGPLTLAEYQASNPVAMKVQVRSEFVGPLTFEQYVASTGVARKQSADGGDGSSSEGVRLMARRDARSGRLFVGPLEEGADSAPAPVALAAMAQAEGQAPTLAGLGDLTQPEGLIDFGQIATFFDPDSVGPFTYQIDWGDNSANASGQAHVDQQGPPTAGWIVASHLYDDDGSYALVVTVTDEQGNSTTEEFALTVENRPPVVDAGGPYEVDEAGTVTLSGSATDAPGDQASLVYEWDLDGDGQFGETGEDAERGDENVQNPVFSAEGLDGPGSRTVSFRSRDDEGAQSQTVHATIQIVNVAPLVAVDHQSVAVQEGVAAANTGTYSDPGGDDVDLDVSAGTIQDNGDGTWTWSSGTIDNPEDFAVVTVTATDKDGAAGTVTFSVTVENVPPVVTVDEESVTVEEGQTAVNTGAYNDPGADAVTLEASVGEIVDEGAGKWSWSFDTTDGPLQSQLVTIKATDSDGGSSSTSFDLVVENVAPSAAVNEGSVAVDEGEVATNTGTYQDPGDDALAFAASVGTVVDGGNGTWSWSLQTTDGPDDSGTVTVTITDKDGGQAAVTFELAVANVAPSLAVDQTEVEVLEGQAAANTGTYAEPGDDTLVFAASVGTVACRGDGTWSWSFVPEDGPDATQVVTVTVTDSDGDKATVTFDLVVKNAPPVANGDYYVFDGVGVLDVNAAEGVLANDSDPGGDRIVVDSWGDPSVGQLAERRPDGSFVYVGPDGFSGTVTFNYTIRDEDGALSEHEAVVRIDVGMNAAVTGYVYARNADSRFQPVELPLPGVFVTLTAIDDTDRRGMVEINTITDDQGRYRFEGLRAGEYRIEARQPAACQVGEELATTVTLGANQEGQASGLYTGWLRPTSMSIGSFLGSTIRTSATTYGWQHGLREQMARAEERAGDAEAAYWIRLGEVIQVARRGREVTVTGTSRDEAFEFLPATDGYHVSLDQWSAVYSADSTSRLLVRSGGGDDDAVLHDSALDDLLTAEFNSVSLVNDEFACELRDFSFVKARSEAGGDDSKSIARNIDFVLKALGDWD